MARGSGLHPARSGRRAQDSVESRRALVVALALLALSGVVLIAGQLADRNQRPVEATIDAYFRAIEREDLEGALAELVPERRAELRDFVQNQLGHRHRVLGVAVRAPSLADRLLRGAPATPGEATVRVDVTNTAGQTWRATTTVQLERRGGDWLLRTAPLEGS